MHALSNVVYLCPYQRWNFADFEQRHLAVLSSEEKQRYHRFKHIPARQQFLLGRVLIRHFLSQHLQCDGQSLRFSHNDHQRPFLANTPLDFNLSHTDGAVMLAISGSGRVGVDVESNRRGGKTIEIADHFFHPQEVQAILAAGDRQQQEEAFFRFWTLKESYVKAMGQGLQKSLQSFYFSITDPAITLADEKIAPSQKRVQMRSFKLWQHFQIGWLKLDGEQHSNAPEFFIVEEDLTVTPMQITADFYTQGAEVLKL